MNKEEALEIVKRFYCVGDNCDGCKYNKLVEVEDDDLVPLADVIIKGVAYFEICSTEELEEDMNNARSFVDNLIEESMENLRFAHEFNRLEINYGRKDD